MIWILPSMMILINASISIVFSIIIGFLLRRSRKQEKINSILTTKNNKLESQIKSLHSNQKMLASMIRNIHRDLRRYGEIRSHQIN
jgi:uncharacterized membrane-anchored protein YhcB (DUF1043 family)